MSIYKGIQLPKINEENLDDRKQRKQILNALMMLDEKLKYMFQNIEIEENFGKDSQEMFFQYGKDIKNVITDTEGRFSLFEQTINGISMAVQDAEGNISLLQQTAAGLSSSVASVEGKVSTLEQTAERIETAVYDLEGDISTVTQTANSLKSTVSSMGDDLDDLDDAISSVEQTANKIEWIIASGTSASKMVLTDEFLEICADHIDIKAEVRLYDEMKIYSEETGSTYGGWLSYGTGNNGEGNTTGVMLASKDQWSYFIATNSGVRMTYDDTCAVYCIDGEVTLVADGWEVTLDDTNGNWCPGDDDEQLLGKSSRLWQGLYAGNATIQTSDRRKKNSIEYDMEKYEEFFGMLKPTQYKMNNGDSGRYHVGFISQDIEEAMERAGLDSLEFAGFIKSPVHEVEFDNGDYDETTPIIDYKYALRYAEFVALNTHMIQKLMKRVDELERKAGAS